MKRRHIRRAVLILLTLTAAVAVVLVLRSFVTPSVSRSRVMTSVVEIGSINSSLSASGVVVPEYEQAITSPVWSTVLEVIHHPGDTVEPGQSVVRLDTEAAEFRVEQQRDQLNVQLNKRRQLILDLNRKTGDLSASQDIKQLEVKFKQAQSDRIRRLHEIGGATDEMLAEAELGLNIAQREALQLTQNMESQKKTLEAEIDGLDLQMQMKQDELAEAERDLELAHIQAAHRGVVTWVNDNIGSHVNSGDVVARVADLDSYKIEARISDVHADRLREGCEVSVRVGHVRLSGKISAVKPSVENGVASFNVALDDGSNPALRPNLRVDVFVITSCKDSVLRVANGPFYKGKVDQKIFIIDGSTARRREVDIGISNYDFVELVGDVHPGEKVIISDMSKYDYAERVNLVN